MGHVQDLKSIKARMLKHGITEYVREKDNLEISIIRYLEKLSAGVAK